MPLQFGNDIKPIQEQPTPNQQANEPLAFGNNLQPFGKSIQLPPAYKGMTARGTYDLAVRDSLKAKDDMDKYDYGSKKYQSAAETYRAANEYLQKMYEFEKSK